MAICSQCKTPLTVPADMAGKWVRCPSCHESFLAEESSLVEPFDPASIAPGKAPHSPPLHTMDQARFEHGSEPSALLQIVTKTLDQREKQQSWLRVRSGLKMMYIGSILGAGSFLALALVDIGQILVLDLIGPRFVANPPPFLPDPDYLDLAVFGLLAGTCLGCVIYLVGTCQCFATPVRFARLWLAAQQLFLFLAVVLAIGMYAADDSLKQQWLDFNVLARYTGPLLVFSLAALECLAVYLEKLAQFLGNRAVADKSRKYVVYQIVWLPLSFYVLCIAINHATEFVEALKENADPPIARLTCWLLLLAAVGGGGGILTLTWTLRLLRATWESISPADEG